jgi:hypothetical protein
VCNILPAAHAITGCDTTSSFFGIGKKIMLKALKETPDQFSDLSMIFHADVDDSVDVCRKLISRLYDTGTCFIQKIYAVKKRRGAYIF